MFTLKMDIHTLELKRPGNANDGRAMQMSANVHSIYTHAVPVMTCPLARERPLCSGVPSSRRPFRSDRPVAALLLTQESLPAALECIVLNRL